MFFEWHDNDLILSVRVQLRAANDAFSEHNNDFIKIRITAPPVDGKANQHLVTFLSKTYKIAKSNIQLLSGETGRNKRLLIQQPKVLPEIISHHMT